MEEFIMKKYILIITILSVIMLTSIFSACTFKQEDILTDKDSITAITLIFADGITAQLNEEQIEKVEKVIDNLGELSYDANNLLQGQLDWKYDYTFKLTVERKKFLFFKEKRTEYFYFGTHLTHTNDKGETKEYNDDYEWCYINALKYTKQMDKEQAVQFREYFDKINLDLRKEKYLNIKETFKNSGYAIIELDSSELTSVTNNETGEVIYINASEGFYAQKGENTYRFYLTDDLEKATSFAYKMQKYGGKNIGCLCGYGNIDDIDFLNGIYS